MAVVWVKEIWLGREGDLSGLAGLTTAYVRRLKRSFLVFCDDPQDDASVVMDDAAIPQIGDAHPTFGSAVCLNVRPSQHAESKRHWTVSAEYTAEDPLEEPAEVSWDSQEYQEALEEDAAGDAIVNSAYDPYDPPPTEPRAWRTLTITINRSTYAPLTVDDYLFKVNSVAWGDFVAGTMWMRRYSARRAYRHGTAYWPTTYMWYIRKAGWSLKLLDQGFRELVTISTWRTIYDDVGRPHGKPSLLNGSGQALAPGGTPVYNTFTTKLSADFNDIITPVEADL